MRHVTYIALIMIIKSSLFIMLISVSAFSQGRDSLQTLSLFTHDPKEIVDKLSSYNYRILDSPSGTSYYRFTRPIDSTYSVNGLRLYDYEYSLSTFGDTLYYEHSKHSKPPLYDEKRLCFDGVTVVSKDHRIEQIGMYTNRFEVKGVKVGMTTDDVAKIFPEARNVLMGTGAIMISYGRGIMTIRYFDGIVRWIYLWSGQG